MSAIQYLLAHDAPEVLSIATLLRQHGEDIKVVESFDRSDDDEGEAVKAIGLAPLVDCLLIGPPTADVRDTAALSNVLTRSFALIKMALVTWGPEIDGRIIVLLPSETAMGDPSNPTGSALASAILSLCRTVALECRRGHSTINTILYGAMDAAIAESIAVQITALAHQASRSVNGQEIFITGASDVGRLHP